MEKFLMRVKKLRWTKESFFLAVSFVFITSFGVRLIMVMLGVNPFYTTSALMVNPKVFTSDSGAYSVFLGGSIQVTALYQDGTMRDVDVRDTDYFNHSYMKVKSNIFMVNFSPYADKDTFTYSQKYLAALQVFCTDPAIEKILISRNLVQGDVGRKKKTFSTVVECSTAPDFVKNYE